MFFFIFLYGTPDKKNTQKCTPYKPNFQKEKKYDVQECVNFKFLLPHVNKILCVMRLKSGKSNVHKYTHTHTHTHLLPILHPQECINNIVNNALAACLALILLPYS